MEVLVRRLQQLADSQGPPCPVPLVLLAVDRVKDIASQYGVSAAQQLNGQLAARLLRIVHGDGNVFCAALGYFLVVLSAARDEVGGRRDAEAIRAQLSGTYVVGTQFMRANVRFGVAMYDGSETKIEQLLARATADLEG